MTPLHHPIAHVGVRPRFRGQRWGGRFLRTVRDAVCFAGVILTAPLSRYPVRTRNDEGTRSLPGDDLLPDAKGRWTNGITIHARPSEIWPWLVQMGCRRAGWYSYDGLDNGGIRSAGQIVAELQEVQVGDLFPWTPTAEDGFVLEAIEPGRALVLGGDAGTLYRVRWAFVQQDREFPGERHATTGCHQHSSLQR